MRVTEQGTVMHRTRTDLVGLAGKEHSPVTDAKCTFLLLAFLIDFGDGPCLDRTCMRLSFALVYQLSWIGVGGFGRLWHG